MHTKSRSKLFAVSLDHRDSQVVIVCVLCVQKALEEAKVFVENGELPKGMTEKPPQSDSQESEGEEEAEEKEVWRGV